MNKEFWKKHLTRGTIIFWIIKAIMGLQNVIYPKPSIQETVVSNKLETIYDIDTETFKILDKTDVSFTLRPRLNCMNTEIVIMALSAPNNTEKREKLREMLKDRSGQTSNNLVTHY